MDHGMFNLNRLNRAMGRAVRKDLIHFSHTSPEVQYKWQRYKDNVIIKSKPKNTDRRYSNTNFYLVKFIYIAKTFLMLDQDLMLILSKFLKGIE
jgi:hypothetical protein